MRPPLSSPAAAASSNTPYDVQRVQRTRAALFVGGPLLLLLLLYCFSGGSNSAPRHAGAWASAVRITKSIGGKGHSAHQAGLPRKFEIVLALGDEPLLGVREMLSNFTSLVMASLQVKPYTIVYYRSEVRDIDGVAQHLQPDDILLLPNIADESWTFLTHIVTNYEELADLTLFTHPDATHLQHSMRLLQQSLVINTGFLGLGPLGACKCDGKGCPSWRDWAPEIMDIHARLGKQLCAGKPQQFVFSGGGHFVVSSKRLRSRSVQVYDEIRDALSAAPEANMTRLTHILERSWSLMFECHAMQLLDTCCSNVYHWSDPGPGRKGWACKGPQLAAPLSSAAPPRVLEPAKKPEWDLSGSNCQCLDDNH